MKAPTIFGLYGAGGFGREVMPMVQYQELFRSDVNNEFDFQIYFVESSTKKRLVNGIPLISEEDFFRMECDRRFFNVAISNSRIREEVVGRFLARGATPMSLYSPNSTTYGNNKVGVGAIICTYSMITSNSEIGKFFHSNLYSYVAHDCVIGNFVTFAPNVHCNGNVHIRDHAYIGAGAIIKQGTLDKPLIIGEGAIVGMGAVVTKSVEPFTTVIGNPAKPFVKL